jgi:magnesium transporter
MTPLHSRLSKKTGLAPGSVVYVGVQRTEDVVIDVIEYSAEEHREWRAAKLEDVFRLRDDVSLSWINVSGVHNVEVIEKLGNHFGLHPLLQEDLANTGQRPKIEDAGEVMCIILKMLSWNSNEERIAVEQVSVVFGRTWVITFQERPGDVFNPIRERLRRASPRLRFQTSDYLAYTLMDTVVDNYFLVLEHLGEAIETVEDIMLDRPESSALETVQQLRRDLMFLRRSVWPLREAIGGLARVESPLVNHATAPYLRDLYEHVIQVIDTIENFRDMVSGLLDIYLSSVSNRMNEVMKVLTVIATIFIPLGFLAGVYGMNFDRDAGPFNLPELGWRYGYPLFWLVAVAIGGGLFWFFRRRRWI